MELLHHAGAIMPLHMCMMLNARILMLALTMSGCTIGGGFYSHRQHAFLPLGERARLVGAWRAADGRALVLSSDGRYSRSGLTGCWDADGRTLYFVSGCVNYGATPGSIILAVAEARDDCAYALGAMLGIEKCVLAGEYRREKEPTVVPSAPR